MMLADLGRRGFVSGHMDGFGHLYLISEEPCLLRSS